MNDMKKDMAILISTNPKKCARRKFTQKSILQVGPFSVHLEVGGLEEELQKTSEILHSLVDSAAK